MKGTCEVCYEYKTIIKRLFDTKMGILKTFYVCDKCLSIIERYQEMTE